MSLRKPMEIRSKIMMIACNEDIDYTEIQRKHLNEYRLLYMKYFYSKRKTEKLNEMLNEIVEHPYYKSNYIDYFTYLLRFSAISAENDLKEEQKNQTNLESELDALIASSPIRESLIKHTEYYEKKNGKFGVDWI